ncbi:MAG: zinc ribbon domain-containing protein, partial [Alistipes sp.]|nr:zinc ribbon domain-containing protein [Alistipes sp.]
MKCYSCNHTNPSSSRFCVECGAPFFKRCGNCGEESLFSNKFCPNCGNAYDVKLDALTRFNRK